MSYGYDDYNPYHGGYDMGGAYRDDLGDSYRGVGGYGGGGYETYDIPYYSDAYDHDLYGGYYGEEDDYYGAYGDLLEFEETLRLQHDISEEERLWRWQERQEFEELAEDERMRRYEMMAEEDRYRLGLADNSWWGSRYGNYGYSGGQSSNWRSRYGGRLGAWSSSRLPLSNSLTSRFNRIWRPHGHNTISGVADGVSSRLYGMEQRLRYARDRAQMSALADEERYRMRLEAEDLEREMERIRLENQLETERWRNDLRLQEERNQLEMQRYHQQVQREEERVRIANALEEERYRNDLRREEMYRAEELRSEIQSLGEEERLRREIDMVGSGYGRGFY